MSRFVRASRLLRPDDIVEHVGLITPEFLAARGLRGLLVDLDNTLVPYGSFDDREEALTWVEETRGAGIRLLMHSNATNARAAEWMARLGLEGVGMAAKPNPRGFAAAARALDLPPHQVGMVGDQVFTDVLGANLAGMHTVLVHPLADNALLHTRLARRLERRVLARHGHVWGPEIWRALQSDQDLQNND